MRMKLESGKRYAALALSAVMLAGCGNAAGTKATQAETTATAETEAQTAAEEEQADGVVKTTAGLVQGTKENGIYRYLGVPYAEAKERFVPAEEITPWEGIRMADTYGPMSPQAQISGVDGEAISSSGDVVVVSVNHRLNVFGYLDLSAYDEKYKYSANVGLMDIVDSLKWIQDNIEAFDGDPENVTLFGQSGGGAKVLAMMTSPYAKGLFEKGIVQSGATETMGVKFNTHESSTVLAENILKNLNITPENLEEIQNVSVEDLEAAASDALVQTGEQLQIPTWTGDSYAVDWEPVVDGDFLPTDPVTDDSFAEAGKDIPLLIGSNLNEWTGYFESDPVTPTDELTAALKEAYPDKTDLTAEHVDTTLIRLPILKIMAHKADQGGAPVYGYVFTYGNSFHGAEIPYVFDHPEDNEEQKALAAQISQAWINFARNGVPEADGMPEWEPYTREGGATMILDTQSKLVHNHDQKLLKILAPDYVY